MTQDLHSKKVLIITANTGIERDELLKPMEALKAHGAQVVHATLKGGEAQTWLHDSEHDVSVHSDATLKGLKAKDFDLLVIPGGTVNADTLRQDADAQRLVREFSSSGKPVAAICHGPWLLIDAGVLDSKTLTSYVSIRPDLVNAGADWVDAQVKVCPAEGWTLITSRQPDDLPAFNEALSNALQAA
ncbi:MULTISPECIES: type 1 glutamine amidotransferase domain-containing protein [unclassified Pseudomonas]|uniref:type 1 glutamine amidotransferase domain-containing protein n=1 Tax=unclassified Pseudomonas TaxID=196821 RepID=UPI00384E403E